MDVIILLVLVILVLIFFRTFKNFVYLLGILEIFFRLIHAIKAKLAITEFSAFVNKYIPGSIVDVISKYSTGILKDVLVWAFIVMIAIFLGYLIKYFFKLK